MAKRRSSQVVLAQVVIVVVLVLWAGSLVLNAVIPSYSPPDSISLAFMAILGPLVGSLLVKRGKDDADDPSSPDSGDDA